MITKEGEMITLETLLDNPDHVMAKLERRGEWTATSDIYNTGYCAKNGHLVTIRWSINWNEAAQSVFCVGRDATERSKYEHRLEQSDHLFDPLRGWFPSQRALPVW